MAIYQDEKHLNKIAENNRSRNPIAWAIGGVFFLALLGALFFYDGRDATTVPGPNTPNVVNNPTGSK
jgi:hypothetical protein